VDQLGGQGVEAVPLVRRIAILQADGLPLHIAEVAETLSKGIEGEDLGIIGVRAVRWLVRPEHTNQWDVAVLRCGGAWRPQDTQSKNDEDPDSAEPLAGLRTSVPGLLVLLMDTTDRGGHDALLAVQGILLSIPASSSVFASCAAEAA
jgi:hypothetical protein